MDAYYINGWGVYQYFIMMSRMVKENLDHSHVDVGVFIPISVCHDS